MVLEFAVIDVIDSDKVEIGLISNNDECNTTHLFKVYRKDVPVLKSLISQLHGENGEIPGDIDNPAFKINSNGFFYTQNSGGFKLVFYSNIRKGTSFFTIKNKERIVEFANFVIGLFE